MVSGRRSNRRHCFRGLGDAQLGLVRDGGVRRVVHDRSGRGGRRARDGACRRVRDPDRPGFRCAPVDRRSGRRLRAAGDAHRARRERPPLARRLEGRPQLQGRRHGFLQGLELHRSREEQGRGRRTPRSGTSSPRRATKVPRARKVPRASRARTAQPVPPDPRERRDLKGPPARMEPRDLKARRGLREPTERPGPRARRARSVLKARPARTS